MLPEDSFRRAVLHNMGSFALALGADSRCSSQRYIFRATSR